MKLVRTVRRCVAVGLVLGLTAALAAAPSSAGAAADASGLVDSVTPLSNGFLKHVYYQDGKEAGRLVAVAGAALRISGDGASSVATVTEPPEAEPTTDQAVAAAQARLMGYTGDDWIRVMKEPDAGSMPNGRPNPNPVQVRTLQPLAQTNVDPIAPEPPCDSGGYQHQDPNWPYARGAVAWERWCLRADNDPAHRYSIENSHITAVANAGSRFPLDQVRLGNYYQWGLPYQWNPASTYDSGGCHTGYFEITGGFPALNGKVHQDFKFCPARVKFASSDLETPGTHVTGMWEGRNGDQLELATQTKERVDNDKLAGISFQDYLHVTCVGIGC